MGETFEVRYECDVCQRSSVKVHSEASATAAARFLCGWLRVEVERVELPPHDPAYRTTTLVCPKCTAGERAPVPSDLAGTRCNPFNVSEPAKRNERPDPTGGAQ